MAGSVYFNANVALDLNGDTSAGAKAYFYQTGTSTPVTVYADAGLTTPHASPLVADANGRFATVYVSGAVQLRVTVTDADDATLPGYPVDPAIIESSGATASNVSFAPTARIASTNVQDAIEEVDTALETLEGSVGGLNGIYTTGGTTTAYTITAAGVTSYTTNDRYWVRVNATNTGAVTLNVTGAGAKDVQQYDSAGLLANLSAGQFQIGSEYLLHYNGSRFVIISERLAPAADSVWETGTATVPYKATPANIKAAIDAQAPAYAGFKFVDSWEFTSGTPTTVDFTDLENYSSLIVILQDFQMSSGTSAASLRVSDDNGSSFYDGASDYIVMYTTRSLQSTNQASSNIGNLVYGSSARQSVIQIHGFNTASCPTYAQGIGMDSASETLVYAGFQETSVACDAIRIYVSTGNISAGKIYVLGQR